MEWTASDVISLVRTVIWPFLWFLLFFVSGYYFRKELKGFFKGLKKVDGKIGTDGLGFGLSCANEAQVNRPHQDELIQQEAASPASPSEVQEVEVEEGEEKSLSVIVASIRTEGVEAAKASFEELLKGHESKRRILHLRSYFLSQLFSEGNHQGVFADFQSLYEECDDGVSREYIVRSWAGCYSKIKQHDRAQEVINKGLSDIDDEGIRTELIGLLAKSQYAAGDYPRAVETINQRIQTQHDRHEKAALYNTLSEIEFAEGSNVMGALCLEKKAELTPEDTSSLFDAAYNLSIADIPSLSLYFYKRLLDISPNNQSVLNNIGLQAKELGLNVKAVEFQSKAAERDNSLACANLGYAYLRAGFVDRAEEMAHQGLKVKTPHNSNYDLLSQIKKKRNDEADKWDEFIGKSGDQRNNINKYIDAYYARKDGSDCPFVGEWVDQRGDTVSVKAEEDKLFASWEKGRGQGQGGGVLGTAFGGKHIVPPTIGPIVHKTNYNLSGTFNNSAAKISITATNDAPTLLSITPPSYHGLLSYIDEGSGNWIIFSTDLKKPYEVVFKKHKAN